MSDDIDNLRQKMDAIQEDVAAIRRATAARGVRKRSNTCLFGLPLYDIALGPDPETGEMRGHARGIVAIGDFATGVLALGGIARGGFAVGGIAVGLVCFGGLGAGGLAIAGVVLGLIAIGGLAVGGVALGGVALGYYACGGAAFGKYVVGGIAQDPEAVRFFSQWIPGTDRFLH